MRVAYLVEISGDPLVRHPVIDERDNVDEAAYLTDTSWLGPRSPSWKPPLYAYELAVVRAVAGGGPWAPRVAQILMDLASCWLVWSIGRRLFGERVAAGAAAATALCGSTIYFTGELTSASLVTLLGLAVVRVSLWAADRKTWPAWAAAGATVGVATLARGEAALLVVLPAALAWRGADGRTRGARLGIVVAAALAAIAPATIRNGTRGGDAVVLSANGGINLYIGNAPEWRGIVGVRPGPVWERLVREPESDGVRSIGSRHSAWFARRAFARAAEAPGAWLGLMARKIGHYWRGAELPSNFDPYVARDRSVVLAALLWPEPFWLPFGLLAPLGLAGLALAMRRKHPARVLGLPVAAGFVGTVVFFVTSRFRAPIVPLLALLASYAVAEALAAWRAGRRRALLWSSGGVAVGIIVCNFGRFGADDRAAWSTPLRAERYHYLGTVLFAEEGRAADAIEPLSIAATLEPKRASTRINLARALAAVGRGDDAGDALVEALAIVDRDSPGERELEDDARRLFGELIARDAAFAASPRGRGVTCLSRADWDCAVDALVDPPLAGRALLGRGETRLRAGDTAGAIDDLSRARALRPDDAPTRLLLAVTLARAGRAADARAEVEAWRRLEWPRGAYARVAARRGDTLDREALELIVTTYPDDRLAGQAKAIVEAQDRTAQ